MRYRTAWMFAAMLWIGLAGAGRSVHGQSPTIDQGTVGDPGSIGSSLGAPPGDPLDNSMGNSPGAGAAILSPGVGSNSPISGRVGTTGSRAPSSVSDPNQDAAPTASPLGIPTAKPLTPFEVPAYGAYSLPSGSDDDGPADGLTLDLAIDLLVHNNLDLRSKYLEIPQSQADILNAGLRSNPVFYADSQLIPYGSYSAQRPGGQTQYDVNISHPFDLSGKRVARVTYATRAKHVVEAQYQNAVRLAIDQLYSAYVNVLAARQTVIYAKTAVTGLEQLLSVTKQLYEEDASLRPDVNRVIVQLNVGQVGLSESEEGLKRAKRDLAELLNIPAEQAESIEIRGPLQDLAPHPGSLPDLANLARTVRPDVTAYRLGILTAEANVALQKANRYPDVYMLYQPYTFQSNAPTGLKSPTSWALGVTVPIPLYNRNQGGIARAKLNVTQSAIELATVERQVVTQVQQAFNEYEVTRRTLEKIRKELEPAAKSIREDTEQLYIRGEVNVVILLNAQREYQNVVKQYLDTAVRHRRAMLTLNTAVGQRILP